MKKLLLLSAGMILAAGMAYADITADQLVAAYQADGFTTIEVTTGAGQIKVEAVKDTTKLEVVYDAASGTILKQEQSTVSADEAGQGVEVKSSDKTFVKDASAEDDQGTETENETGDDNGSGAGSDDNGGDDNGTDASGDDKGSDASGDDSGSSGSGSDDNGGDSGSSGSGSDSED